MKRERVALSLLLVGLTAWAACTASSSGGDRQAGGQAKMSEPSPVPSPQPRPYSTNLEELRAAFNRDKGKVRLVTLLSPT